MKDYLEGSGKYKKKMNRIEFAEALERRLSGLQGDPWLAQRIIAKE